MRGFQCDLAKTPTLHEPIERLADFIPVVGISKKMEGNFGRGPVEGNSHREKANLIISVARRA